MEKLWDVTIEDLGIAACLNYKFEGSVDTGWSFTRGSCSIWKCKDGWQTARVDHHNIYENHKLYDNLQDALRRDW